MYACVVSVGERNKICFRKETREREREREREKEREILKRRI